jgi:hypothetical protein
MESKQEQSMSRAFSWASFTLLLIGPDFDEAKPGGRKQTRDK